MRRCCRQGATRCRCDADGAPKPGAPGSAVDQVVLGGARVLEDVDETLVGHDTGRSKVSADAEGLILEQIKDLAANVSGSRVGQRGDVADSALWGAWLQSELVSLAASRLADSWRGSSPAADASAQLDACRVARRPRLTLRRSSTPVAWLADRSSRFSVARRLLRGSPPEAHASAQLDACRVARRAEAHASA